MNILELIERELQALSPEQQREVLGFIFFLKQRAVARPPRPFRSLRDHPAFGLWKSRQMDALAYPESLRAEWEPPIRPDLLP
jgi:mRNA-degrading endonuclease RelE of RelBE toxin-antitoxin system